MQRLAQKCISITTTTKSLFSKNQCCNFYTNTPHLYAGHNKWSKIKHHKAEQDLKRSQQYSKVAKEITSAVRSGGIDPDSNLRLRFAYDRAKQFNLPKVAIENAIKAGLSAKDESSLEKIQYEGYGAAGVAVVVDCITDKRTRTAQTLRKLFSDYSGSLGNPGSVVWDFVSRGRLCVDDVSKADQIMEIAIQNDADDINVEQDEIEILCEPAQVHKLKNELEKQGIACSTCELTLHANNKIEINVNTEEGEQIVKFIDLLEEHEDVQHVYHNAKFVES